VNKFHGIGLVVLLAVTFFMINNEDAFALLGSKVFINQDNNATEGFGFNNQEDIVTGFVATSGGLYMVYNNNNGTVHDLIFQKSTDGSTVTAPLIIDTTSTDGTGFNRFRDIHLFVTGTTIDILTSRENDRGVTNNHTMLHYRSTDDGVSFASPNTIVDQVVGTNIPVHFDVDGNFISLVFKDLTFGDVLNYTRSTDGGSTFSTPFQIDDGSVFDSQNDIVVEQSSDGTKIWVTWDGNRGISPFDKSVRYSRSIDSGATFSTPITLSNSTAGVNSGAVKHNFLFVSGSKVSVFFDSEDLFTTPTFSQVRSTDSGATFTAQEDAFVGFTEGGLCAWELPSVDSVLIAQSGTSENIYLMCPDGFDGKDVFTAKTTNMGLTWSSLTSITTDPDDDADSDRDWWMEAVGDNVYYLWRSNDNQSPFDFSDRFVFSTDKATTFSTEQKLNLNVASNMPVIAGFDNDRYVGFDDPTNNVVFFSDLPIDFITYKNSVGSKCTTDQNFTCPLNLSQEVAISNTRPTEMRGVGTTNGFFAIWDETVSGNERIVYASTTDGQTGTTPILISGVSATGQDEDQMFIFEDGGTLGSNIIDIFWRELDATDANSDLHFNRSTDGGSTFPNFLQIEDNLDHFFPVVDGQNIYVFYMDSTADVRITRSLDGGSTFPLDVTIAGGNDECDAPDAPIKAIKDSDGNLHVVWHGQNATDVGNAEAICYNRSTDNGSTWSATVQILSNLVTAEGVSFEVTLPFEHELEIFDSGSSVTALWRNINDDAILQARSSNNGVSFGTVEKPLDTGGAGNNCTDPSIIALIVGVDSDIYILCQGSGGDIEYIVSNNMGVSYSTQAPLFVNTAGSGYQIGSTVGFGTTDRTFFMTKNIGFSTDNRLGFTDDNGSTFDTSLKTPNGLFFDSETGDVLSGNKTHAWFGFVHSQDSVKNAWVSLGTFFDPAPTPPPPANNPPVITILGDNPLEHLINTTYTDAGATCSDVEDGSIATVDVSTVNSSIVGTYTVTYTCTDSGSLVDQEIRTVNVVEQLTTTTVTGGGAGAPVSGTVDTGIEGFTPEQQLAFDQAVEDAIASIEPSEGNIVESLIQTFFEFIVVDRVHEELQLQSFLDDQRLGFRWSTGDDLVIVSATPALSPFMFTFEQFPVVKQGSGAFVSTNFILYNLEVPRLECTTTISVNCVEKIRYEIPVTVNAIINGTQVSDTGTITVDLTEDEIDPILLIILSLFAIPVIGVLVQRSRGRSSIEPLRRVIS